MQSVEDGDQVWSEWEMNGKTRGGDDFLVRGVAILRARDGRFTFCRFYLDNVDKAGTADAGAS